MVTIFKLNKSIYKTLSMGWRESVQDLADEERPKATPLVTAPNPQPLCMARVRCFKQFEFRNHVALLYYIIPPKSG